LIRGNMHKGLRLHMGNALDSIPLDSGVKYDRYLAIAYLPAKGQLPSCLCVGNLEVGKDGGKEFYNPAKFYHPEVMREAIMRLIAAYAAFASLKTGREDYAILNSLVSELYGDRRLREKLSRLASAYRRAMLELEKASGTPCPSSRRDA